METPAVSDNTRHNLRLSRTEFRHGEEQWYILDNAAAFMPALTNSTATLVFRISATLNSTIVLPVLEAALATIAPRFPYYLVVLRRGFFWYYMEPASAKRPRISADSKYPCQNMRARRGDFLFRIRAYSSRIAVEFCHILTDGAGALIFLKALVLEYCRLLGHDIPDTGGIFTASEVPNDEESEDAFNRHVQPGIPAPEPARRAFHIPAMRLWPGQYRIITGQMPLDAVMRLSKQHGTSLTELLAAIYLAALQEMFYALPGPVRKTLPPILALEVPVNLRRLFSSRTMRNFSLYVLPSLNTRLGYYEFDEIANLVHLYLQEAVSVKNMARQLSRNVMGGRSLLIRALPLGIKNLAAKLVYKRMGENTMSGSLSNLGLVQLPQALSALVEGFAFIPPPSRVCKTKAACVGYNNDLYISFGSLAATVELERLFFVRMERMGIPINITSNV
ncbi:MAG: hypothetical protein ABSF43_04260 [Rectinemataceae bacterium]